jgi:hypothetical protein
MDLKYCIGGAVISNNHVERVYSFNIDLYFLTL